MTADAAARRPAAPTGWARVAGPAIAALDVVLPIVGYYVARAAGLEEVAALVASAAVSVLGVAVHLAATRRVGPVPLGVLAVVVVNLVVALVSHDPRTLLLRDGWITAVVGLGFLATLVRGHAAVFSIVRPLAEGRIGPRDLSWDEIWERFPRVRRVFGVLTAIWGVGLLVDAAVRVVLALTLPIDVVPAVNGIQYAVVYVVLQAISQVYFRRSGLLQSPSFAREAR